MHLIRVQNQLNYLISVKPESAINQIIKQDVRYRYVFTVKMRSANTGLDSY